MNKNIKIWYIEKQEFLDISKGSNCYYDSLTKQVYQDGINITDKCDIQVIAEKNEETIESIIKKFDFDKVLKVVNFLEGDKRDKTSLKDLKKEVEGLLDYLFIRKDFEDENNFYTESDNFRGEIFNGEIHLIFVCESQFRNIF